MKIGSLSLVIGTAAFVASASNADVVAYWNFNNSTAGSGGGLGTLNGGYPFAADQGAGSLYSDFSINTVAGAAAANTGDLGTFGGTLINALGADTAGGALALRAGNGVNSGVTNNGKFVEFRISTVGFVGDLILTYAAQRTSTGFTDQLWQYSTDGGSTFTAYQNVNGLGTFALQTVNFTAASLGGVADLRIRAVVTGATNQGGNNRLDNVQFNASRIPTPGSLALLGLGGLLAARRRR